jgi:pimeloyl-ACP methyl ester carboxylesterase
MSRTKLLVRFFLLATLLVACRSVPTATGQQSTVTPTEEVLDPTATDAPAPTATDAPAPTATDAPAPTATDAPEPAATFEQAPCPFALPSGHVDGQTVECGYLVVPEDRADPSGRRIRLAVAILRHPGGAPEPDPIIYLEGGPGGSALEIRMPNLDVLFGPIWAANRDIILFDQRGVGFSEPTLDCPGYTERYLDLLDGEVDGMRLTAREVRDRKVEAFLACAEDLRAVADLSAYNTAANAADVNDLRVALGYRTVNLWGGSYGTRLALGVMRDYLEGVRSAVLDAPYGPEVDLYLATPGSYDRALGVLVEQCAADAACNAAYPDLRSVLTETVERLNADPATVRVIHPRTRETYDKLLDGDGLAELVFRSLYDTSMRPLLPQAIYEASEDRFHAFVPAAMLDILRQEFRSWGMYWSVLCHEEIPFGTQEAFEAVLAETPEFAGFFQGFEVGGLAYAVCPGWGAGQADVRENEPVASEVPTLIVTGEYDPIVPPDWGQGAAQTLTHSYFYEYAGMGHVVSFGGCPREMVLAFLDDPSSAPDDACMAEMEVAPFVVPVQATEIELTAFASDELGLRGVVPAGWSQVQPGIFARGNPAADMAVLQVVVEGAMGVQEMQEAMAKAYGLAKAPEPTGERRANELTWSLYAFQVQGIPRDLGLAESQAGTLVVVLRSAPNEQEALYEAVFLPVVDALVPVE